VKELALEFMETFAGLDRAYGIYEIHGTKETAKGTRKTAEAGLYKSNCPWSTGRST